MQIADPAAVSTGSQPTPAPPPINAQVQVLRKELEALTSKVEQLSADKEDSSFDSSDIIASLALIATVVLGFIAIRQANRADGRSRESLQQADVANKHSNDANELAQKAHHASERSILVSQGQSEVALRQAIAVAQKESKDVMKEGLTLVAGRTKSAMKPAELRMLESIRARISAAVEQEFTVYDMACRQYRESKIDRVAFKQDYAKEIRRICEETHDLYQQVRGQMPTSPFKNVWSVYQEWNPE
jgi:uncharacterized protein (UPF0335 family)